MAPEHQMKDYEYTTLMDMLHVSVSKHLLDEHFTLVWANDYYYELIGYPKAEYEALYHNRPDLYYAEDPQNWEKVGIEVTKALETKSGGYRLLSRLRKKSGEFIWVQFAATFVEEYIDGCQVAYTVLTDVNDVIQTQMEQSVAYDNLPGFVGKFRVDRDLKFTLLDANDRFVQFFGEKCWKNDGDPLFQKNVRRNAAVFEASRAEILAGEPVRFTTQMEDQRGSDAWLQVSAACVDWQGGDPVYLAIYIDITNVTELRQMQKKLEEQAEALKKALVQAEHANRAKSDFLSHMSHDIRTPMNAIMGMTDIAKAHMDDPEKVGDCLQKISLSSQHLLGLINDVLDMSRIESGKMTINNDAMSLPAVLENVVAIMQPSIKAKSQRFAIHLHHVRHEQFCSDALRLRQIFINILSNASKFTPVDGGITVDVEELGPGGAETAWLRFSFSDTGMGMQPEFLEQIFTPFSREQDSRVDKTEGSGLGMAITKKLVDLLGGHVEVESRVGKGTTFWVTLPLKIEAAPKADGRFPDLKIIVVDDDDTMREYMDDTLRRMGVRVDCAGTGAEAVERIAAAHRRGERYDAVFLDWKMPDMDGPQTARRIRNEVGRALPILIISAYDWSDIEAEAREVGIDGFIAKPLFVSNLCHALRKYAMGCEPDPEKEERADAKLLRGRRILLVEDNELNQEIATELLADAGAALECACNGRAGVEMFSASAEGYYDLILMDVQMPIMNGYEATAAIRGLGRGDAGTVPILAMTADAFAEDISRAREVGMDGHLAKPLDVATLRREVGRALRVKA